MRAWILATAVLVSFLSPSPAWADGEATSFYGWQPALPDALGIGLFIADSNGTGGMVGFGLVLVDGPLVHALHGHADKAVASLTLRLGLALGGAFIGATTTNSSADFSSSGGARDGLLAGMVAAVVLDDLFIAREQRPVRPRSMISPTFAWTNRRAQVGLVATW